MKKEKDSIRVSFVDSMSSEDVTGSCIYVKTPHHNILLDCGMRQTNDRYKDFLVNKRRPKEFKPQDIDIIFVSHQHIDHIGLIPKMFAMGCDSQVIVADQNKSVMELMLNDCANINDRDVILINSQHDTRYAPLYTTEDVAKTIQHTKQYNINYKYSIDDELSFMLIPNGHLLGSVQILLYLTVNNVTKTLLYTGDIGSNKVYNPFVGEFVPVKNADYVIGECTYGDRPKQKNDKKDRKNDIDKLHSIIETQVKEMKGRVIIPSFAQSRAQELAYFIYQLYKDEDWQPTVYVDSPLAVNIFKEYNCILDEDERKEFDKMLKWEKLKLITESEDSKILTESDEPCVIIATSGMCTVGRIRHHFKKNVPNPNSTVLFVGYSTEGSLASLLKDPKTKTLTIDQKEYPCRCSVYSLKSLSGHAMYSQLMNYYTSINSQRIILHHGSKEAKEYFAKDLKQQLEKNCKTTKVVVSNSSLKFSL